MTLETIRSDFAFLDENVEVRTQELKMAASLIDTMTEDFDPSLYRDAYREALESQPRRSAGPTALQCSAFGATATPISCAA